MKTTRRAWIGRSVTVITGLVFAVSAAMKLIGGEQVEEGMVRFGLSENLIVPLAILELTCSVVYLIPATTVLGAALLTGYLGGAILAHLIAGDPLFVPILIGLLVWLGPYLREERLHALLPRRKPS